MAYTLDPVLFVDGGTAAQLANVAASRPRARLRAWRALSAENRLEITERALKEPANDLIDGHPIAL